MEKFPKADINCGGSESSKKAKRRDVKFIGTDTSLYAERIKGINRDPDADITEEIHLNMDGSFPRYGPVFEKGTTTLAFIFNEGFMIAADHSSESKSAPNVVELNSHMLATISGGSTTLLKELQDKCLQHEVNEGMKLGIEEVLKLLRQVLSSCDEEKLPSGVLIAMWDEKKPGLYRICGEGKVIEDQFLATGCGSGGACAILLTEFSDNMSLAGATKLAKRALCIATYGAPKTGDLYSVYHLGRTGCNWLFTGNVAEWQKENIHAPRCNYVVIGPGW